MTHRICFRNGRVIFRNAVLDELGLEIEWCGCYLNLLMNGEQIHYRSYDWGKEQVYYCDILPMVDKWTNDLRRLLDSVKQKKQSKN
jgi:hypothetical protein